MGWGTFDPSTWLLLVLAAFYLQECVLWHPIDATIFIAPWGRSFQWSKGPGLLCNADGGFRIVPPLPGSQALICQPLPFAMGPEGLVVEPSLTHGSNHPIQRLIGYDEIDSIEIQGNKIWINTHCIQAGSPSSARWFTSTLEALRAAEATQRESIAYSTITESLSVDNVRTHLENPLAAASKAYNRWAWAIFLAIFGLGPTLLYWFKRGPFENPVLLMYLGCVGLVWSTTLVHARRLLAAAPVKDQTSGVGQWFPLVLSPAGLMRLADNSLRDSVSSFHPVAVAAVVCSRKDFARIARRWLAILTFDNAKNCQSDLCLVSVNWYRARVLEQIVSIVEKRGLHLADLMWPPAPDSEASRSFCPVCEAQFCLAEGVCKSCGGIPLRVFSSEV